MNDTMHTIVFSLLMIGLVGFSVWAGIHLALMTIYNMARKDPQRFIRAMLAASQDDDDDAANKAVDDMLEDAGEKSEKKIIRLSISAVNDLLIAHDASTGEFIAQGIDSGELLVSALMRFPSDRYEFTVAVDTDKAKKEATA